MRLVRRSPLSLEGMGARRVGVWVVHSSLIAAALVGLPGIGIAVLVTDRACSELTPAELDALMAHEVAHILHRDLMRYLGLNIAAVAAILAAAQTIQFSGVIRYAVTCGMMVAWAIGLRQYVRHREVQADTHAILETLDPTSYVRMLHKAAASARLHLDASGLFHDSISCRENRVRGLERALIIDGNNPIRISGEGVSPCCHRFRGS